MKLLLSNRGNPDFRQDHRRNLPGTPKDKFLLVGSINEAVAASMDYIDKHDLGGGNWTGGHVLDDDSKLICYIGYSGRVFDSPQELASLSLVLKSRLSKCKAIK